MSSNLKRFKLTGLMGEKIQFSIVFENMVKIIFLKNLKLIF